MIRTIMETQGQMRPREREPQTTHRMLYLPFFPRARIRELEIILFIRISYKRINYYAHCAAGNRLHTNVRSRI